MSSSRAPLADNVENAEKAVATAKRTGKSWSSAIIPAPHPSWNNFEIAAQLGTPLVFRMNLNQQSNKEDWHQRLPDFPPRPSSIAASTMSRHVPDDR